MGEMLRTRTFCVASANYPRCQKAGETTFARVFGTRTIEGAKNSQQLSLTPAPKSADYPKAGSFPNRNWNGIGLRAGRGVLVVFRFGERGYFFGNWIYFHSFVRSR